MSDEQTSLPPLDEFTHRLQQAMRRKPARPVKPPVDAAPATIDADPEVVEPVGGDPSTWGPIGQGEYVVNSSDCMSSLGARTGHLWQTIWDDAANTQLREVRRDPNVLAVGDRVTIPPLRPKTEPGQTEMRHRFVRLGQPTTFQLRLAHGDRPLMQCAYTIKFDSGDEASGSTNDRGELRCRMPSQSRQAKLTVVDGAEEREYQLRFGRLEPIEHLRGVQQRLRNLGFFDGPENDAMSDELSSAIAYYQQRRGLKDTGAADATTRQHLQEEHGS